MLKTISVGNRRIKIKKFCASLLLCAAGFCSISANANNLNDQYVHRLTENGAMSCLTNAVFHEANTEPRLGKTLVAISILNRAVKRNKSICSIIKQPYQFSFYRKGFNWSKRALDKGSLDIVFDILRNSMLGLQGSYGGITHFHTVQISPSWSKNRQFRRYKTVSNHVFYVEEK